MANGLKQGTEGGGRKTECRSHSSSISKTHFLDPTQLAARGSGFYRGCSYLSIIFLQGIRQRSSIGQNNSQYVAGEPFLERAMKYLRLQAKSVRESRAFFHLFPYFTSLHRCRQMSKLECMLTGSYFTPHITSNAAETDFKLARERLRVMHKHGNSGG